MLQSLQAGRALAATAVTAFHLSLMMGDPRYGGETLWHDVTRYGRYGVDFFFVLSGFIILHAHAADMGRPQALGRYAWRRFARLFPLYWLYTAVFTALVLAGAGSAVTDLPVGPADWLTALSLLRFTTSDAPLQVAWTLFHEVAFYLAFAVLVVHRRAGLVVFGLWAAACLLRFEFSGQVPVLLDTYTSLYNLYFLFGMAAWWLSARQSGPPPWALALAAAVLVWLPFSGWWPGSEAAGQLVMGVGLALALAACGRRELRAPMRMPGWLLAIGNSSYSQYLLHIPLAGLLLKIGLAANARAAVGAPGLYVLVLLGTVLLAWCAWRWIEAPLLARLNRRARHPHAARQAAA